MKVNCTLNGVPIFEDALGTLQEGDVVNLGWNVRPQRAFKGFLCQLFGMGPEVEIHVNVIRQGARYDGRLEEIRPAEFVYQRL